MRGRQRSVRSLVRGLLVAGVVGLVLAAAWVAIKGPGSDPDVVALSHRPPVQVTMTRPVGLGHGHAALASGALGLWATRELDGRQPGELLELDTADGRPQQRYPLPVQPQALAVGRRVIWVLGIDPAMPKVATLAQFDPATKRVVTSSLDEPSSCATNAFASCYPVAVAEGVWVPLHDKIVHLSDRGSTADRAVPVAGHIWDMAGAGGQLWVLAESALDRIDPASNEVVQRISLKEVFGPGMKSNHVVASARDVWVSSFPRVASQPSGLITHVDPPGGANKRPFAIAYPGAGSLALQGGGLWVERFDGQGELDRLDARSGALTGPFEPVPDDVTRIVPRGNELWLLSYKSEGNRRTVTKMTLTPER